MGLVSTWLNGIGLSSAVPTFQAAGIVTPDALAELDVAHFEALGVSNPDDRRKLFYLVQRIKLAVSSNKKKRRPRAEDGGTVEQQIETVISGTKLEFATEGKTVSIDRGASHSTDSLHNAEAFNDSKESKEESVGLAIEGRSGANHGQKVDSRRRSKRLTAKQTTLPASPRSAKENRIVQNQVSTSPSKSQLQGQVGTASSEIPTTRRVNDWVNEPAAEEVGTGAQDLPSNPPIDSGLRASDSFEIVGASKNITTRSRRGPGSSLPKPSSARLSIPNNSDTGTTDSTGTEKTAPASRMQTPRASKTQSRLPNPTSKSTRTGKQLSAIPSETAAPMSPLIHLPSAKMDEEIQSQKAIVSKTRRKSGRRRSRSRDSLDQLLDSEGSDRSEAESDSERSLGAEIARSEQREPGHNSDSFIPDPKSRRSMGRDGSGRFAGRKSTGTAVESTPNLSGRRSLSQRTSIGRQKPFGTGAIIHGGSESESWRSQVAQLREDNDAEHELFGMNSEFGNTDYDMRIRVVVRKRPLSKSEENLSGGIDVIHPLDYGDYGRILVYQPKTRVDLTKEIETIPFSFDNVFGEASTNVQIYERSIRNLIGPFFAGQYSSVFAYGQTGSGKTYTMMGSNMTGMVAGTAVEDTSNLGLYYLAALDIFEMAKLPEFSHLSIGVSLFEIYGGKLYDLLNARKQVKCLEDRGGKVCFPGLSEHPVAGPDQLMELIEEGATNRSTGTTSRNADSSRSHAVLQLCLRKALGRKKNVEHGRLTFIDLAGSERGADTNSASRATRLEGAEINTSLLALKEVIRALATGGSMTHIPFRGSKLTQVLKDSFIGKNSRCCMVACISPDIGNCEQTLNTLRYSDRVKERNPESGALSSKCEQPTKARPLKIQSKPRVPPATEISLGGSSSSSATAGLSAAKPDESFMTLNGDDEASDTTDFVSETDTAVLDDLLSTSVHDRTFPASNSSLTQSSKRRAGEALVSEHRAVMSSMLAMVKNEMTLVNKVDADRDGIDDYLAQLEVIQETQLNLIEQLRGALHNYVSAAEGDPPAARGRSGSEDSFEDLRD